MKILKKTRVVIICSAAGLLLAAAAAAMLLRSYSAERRYEKYFDEARLSYREQDWAGARKRSARNGARRYGGRAISCWRRSTHPPGSGCRGENLYAASLKYETPRIAERLAELLARQSEMAGASVDTVDIGGVAVPREDQSHSRGYGFIQRGSVAPVRADGAESLTLTDNRITELSALSALKKLTFLHLGGNRIADLTPWPD